MPPAPPLSFSLALIAALEKVSQALGRFDGITLLLPDSAVFLYPYVRKEALLSSQIEARKPTVRAAITQLSNMGIVNEITGRQRNRLFWSWPWRPLLFWWACCLRRAHGDSATMINKALNLQPERLRKEATMQGEADRH